MSNTVPIPGTPHSLTDLRLPDPAPKIVAAPPPTPAQMARNLVALDLELDEARNQLAELTDKVKLLEERHVAAQRKLENLGQPGTWVVQDKGAVVTIRPCDEQDGWTVDINPFEMA